MNKTFKAGDKIRHDYGAVGEGQVMRLDLGKVVCFFPNQPKGKRVRLLLPQSISHR